MDITSYVVFVEGNIILYECSSFMIGYGSVMNDLGEVEMDALIMDGKSMSSGAVGAISCVKNPIKMARYTFCLSFFKNYITTMWSHCLTPLFHSNFYYEL